MLKQSTNSVFRLTTNENILKSESYELIGIYIQIQYVPYLSCWREFDVKLVYLLSATNMEDIDNTCCNNSCLNISANLKTYVNERKQRDSRGYSDDQAYVIHHFKRRTKQGKHIRVILIRLISYSHSFSYVMRTKKSQINITHVYFPRYGFLQL